jgi:cell division protein FtsB
MLTMSSTRAGSFRRTPRQGSQPQPPPGRRPRGAGPGSRSPGSRRFARQPRPAQTSTEPQPRRPKLTGRAVVLGVVFAVLLVSYASSLRAWIQQRSQLSTLQSQIAQRSRSIANLRTEIGRWHDPAYVEAQARQRFGWVMPGQIGYRVIGRDGRPLDAARALSSTTGPAASGRPDWWSGLWGSIEAAGRTPQHQPGDQRTPASRIGPRPHPRASFTGHTPGPSSGLRQPGSLR